MNKVELIIIGGGAFVIGVIALFGAESVIGDIKNVFSSLKLPSLKLPSLPNIKLPTISPPISQPQYRAWLSQYVSPPSSSSSSSKGSNSVISSGILSGTTVTNHTSMISGHYNSGASITQNLSNAFSGLAQSTAKVENGITVGVGSYNGRTFIGR